MILSQLLNWSLLCCEILCLKNLLCPPFVTGSCAEHASHQMIASICMTERMKCVIFVHTKVLAGNKHSSGCSKRNITLTVTNCTCSYSSCRIVTFKALQMGNVWRADRPQRGRFRQFMQCDIDILGEPTYLAEIELVLATTTLLGKLDFHNFTIRINDRKILKAMAQYSGFPQESFDTVFIILDKMDKIGLEGVAEELEKEGFAKESIDTYLGLFKEITSDIEGVRYCKEKLKDVLDPKVAEDLETIISTVDSVKTADFKMSFDPTLVRGMSYYTGPIFEISMDEFGGSVGGGGRYDEMIGKFTGNNTSACGFSIGFERIVMLLLERNYEIPTKNGKKAYLIEKNMPADKMLTILKQAQEERNAGTQINISIMKKNKKFQKDQMTAEGYTEFVEFFKDRM